MKVLVAEDDKTSLFMLQSLLLKWGYDVIAVSDGDEALRILQGEDPPLLAILDWMLPGESGPEICRRLSSRSLSKGADGKPYQYIIILTVKGEKENVVAGLKAGADDYITKPFDSHELQMRVMVGKRILDLQEQLRNAALYDSLTGLFNRRAVIGRLEEEFERSKRKGTRLSIALLDLDHFKNVNDTYGHAAGDAVLKETAKRIRESVRSYDVAGRYGGEEFLLIFTDLEEQRPHEICERVRKAFESTPFLRGSKNSLPLQDLRVTASIGYCELGDRFDNVDALLAEADKALYRAKENGRNQVSR